MYLKRRKNSSTETDTSPYNIYMVWLVSLLLRCPHSTPPTSISLLAFHPRLLFYLLPLSSHLHVKFPTSLSISRFGSEIRRRLHPGGFGSACVHSNLLYLQSTLEKIRDWNMKDKLRVLNWEISIFGFERSCSFERIVLKLL